MRENQVRRAGSGFVILAVALGAACAMKTTGRLVSLQDGAVIPLQMQFTTMGGHMVGSHPGTGETFEGDYTATPERATARAGHTNVEAQSLTAPGSGVLVGNKGTVLDCQLMINAGSIVSHPTGTGTCTSQKGQRFRLQF